MRKYILSGWPLEVCEKLKPYKRKDHELSIEKGLIFWGHQMVIPKSLRKKMLKELHEGHMGIVKMKALARSYI